jgi:hypothetical protein
MCGDTSDLSGSVLDIKITGRKQKVNFIAGSKEDVKYIVEELNIEGNMSGTKGSYDQLLKIDQMNISQKV